MAGLSSNGETLVLDALLPGRFVSLHTADPGDAGANEVSGGAYARQPVTFVNSGANPTLARNNANVQYPAASANWGTITHFGLWSAASGGTFYISGAMTTPKAVNIDDIARFSTNQLTVSAQ